MILAIDQGTTGTNCLVFDEDAEPVGRAYREFAQHFPKPGWVEHDLREIWQTTVAVAGAALDDAGVRRGDLTALGITNQRETVCAWDADSGEPLYNAIVWQDRRTATRCEQLRAQGKEELVRARTGLVLDPYFSATKIEWLLEHVDGLRERAQSGRALFGTIDSWLIFKLTGEHVTDATNAAVRHRRGSLGSRAAGPVRRPRALARAGAGQRGTVRADARRRAARSRGGGVRRGRRSAGGAVRARLR
jgi:glycerol kinase